MDMHVMWGSNWWGVRVMGVGVGRGIETYYVKDKRWELGRMVIYRVCFPQVLLSISTEKLKDAHVHFYEEENTRQRW